MRKQIGVVGLGLNNPYFYVAGEGFFQINRYSLGQKWSGKRNVIAVAAVDQNAVHLGKLFQI